MHKLYHLWPALEKTRNLKALKARWQEYAAEDYAYLAPFLQATDSKVFYYPCATPANEYCSRTIIRQKNNLSAICPHTTQCARSTLSEEDCVLYECHGHKLSEAIAQALNIEFSFSQTCHPFTYRIGVIERSPSMPVYLSLTNESELLENLINYLHTEIETPVTLLILTNSLITHRIRSLCNRTKCTLLPLSSIVWGNNDGAFIQLYPLHECIGNAAYEEPSGNYFPTPKECTWADITLTFKDGHTLSAKCHSTHRTYNFTQLGMVNQRNGEPTKQWLLLQALAEGHGKLS